MSDAAEAFAAAAAQARQAATESGGALVPLGAGTPEQVRTSAGAHLAEVTRTAQSLEEAAAKYEAELRAKLNAQLAEMREAMAPLKAQIARMKETVWTVNLYLGTDEQIEQLRDGEPAPDGTPITIRQLVLAMDEESLIAAEEGGIDAQRVTDFSAWLLADPRRLEQVMPDPKGVVVLVPTRQSRDYGSVAANMQMDAANSEPHWLIRNGDKLYLLKTDFKVTNRLLPTRAEFNEFFTREEGWGAERRRVPLEPGSEAWLKAEQAAGERRRHYMRVMLILQGLADRTTVFYPLPGGRVNFLSVAAQDDGQVRIINEIDGVLTTGRPSFRQWQHDLAQHLRVGLRIVGVFNNYGAFGSENGHERSSWKHTRLHPQNASLPETGKVYVIEDTNAAGQFLIRYPRTDLVDDLDDWGRYLGQRVAKTRASCALERDDSFILPIDLVDLADAQHYLNARTERHNYREMIPVLRAVIRAKEEEAAAEEPFRMLAAGRIAAAHDVDVDEVLDALPALVDWWKLTNKHQRALVTADDPEMEIRALEAIEREWLARRRDAEGADAAADRARVEQLREQVPAAIAVVRRRDGSYAAYEPADQFGIWLHETRVSRTGRPQGDRREWVQASARTRGSMVLLWSTDRWASWNHNANARAHLTGPELDRVLDFVRADAARAGTLIAVVYRETAPAGWEYNARRLEAYCWTAEPGECTGGGMWGSGRSDDPGRKMVEVRYRWTRESGTTVSVERTNERRPTEWGAFNSDTTSHWTNRRGRVPWGGQTLDHMRLLWSDPDQLAAVDAEWQVIEAEQKVINDREQRNQAVLSDVQRRWAEAEWARLYERFLTDYAGAADLWEGHKKTLKVDFPGGSVQGLYRGIGILLDQCADLTTLTVADAVRADEGDRAQAILDKAPASVVDLPLAVAAEDGES